MIEVKHNIIGSLTRARRTGLVRFYDIHIRVERATFRGTRSFLREYRIIQDTSAGWADIRLCLRNSCRVIYTLEYWLQDGVTSTVMDRHVL